MDHISPNPQYSVPNTSDKFGDFVRTKNVNFDLHGYVKLSDRTVRVYSENDDSNFGLPLAIGRQAIGKFQIATGESNFGATITTSASTVSEDTGTANPSTTLDSDACWFQGLWHVSTATAVLSRPATGGASGTYTSRVTGLASGYRHILTVNQSRVQICVSNGNVVKQYDTTYANTTDLTIPSDYEVSGMAYNDGNMGIITRLANDGTNGQDQEAMFYLWSGASTSASVSVSVGDDAAIAVIPYKSSFVIVTRNGLVKYFNGAGFQDLATFPFYFSKYISGDQQANNALGNVFLTVDGDNILLNIGNELSVVSRTGENTLAAQYAGVWCYDPRVGLYHRTSLSNSPMYIYAVTSGNVNTSTNELTISSGTVPATGNIARLINAAGIGGLTERYDYFIVKTGATTFKLAETRDEAMVGAVIDLTSATSGTNYFLMIDHVDYCTNKYDFPGAIRLVGDAGNNYGITGELMAGGRITDTDGTTLDCVCINVPWFENRGLLETAKYYSPIERSKAAEYEVRFNPLREDSSIEVYARTSEYVGIPVSSGADGATWSGEKSLYTSHDMSDAETVLNQGVSIMMEVLGGVGGGEFVKVESITCSGGVCAIELESAVFGATAGTKCDILLTNYEKHCTIASEDNDDGHKHVSIDAPSSTFTQFLLYLKGSDITISQMYYKDTFK